MVRVRPVVGVVVLVVVLVVLVVRVVLLRVGWERGSSKVLRSAGKRRGRGNWLVGLGGADLEESLTIIGVDQVVVIVEVDGGDVLVVAAAWGGHGGV
jgi:uncharacterized protein with GYD domain